MTTKSVDSSRSRLWLAAIKPPMYSVAVIPIWTGTAVALAETGTFVGQTFFTFLAAAILIVAWSNLSNDVYDADTGIDKNKAHSLVNLTGNQPLIFWIGNGFLVLGVLAILAIAWWQRDWTVLGIISLCCALGYMYQGPPFRLGYQGLGEVLCFFAYGPLAVSAAYYSQVQHWSAMNLVASVIIGLTTSLILFCSHFHQVKDDLAAGKYSPIVRLGTQRSAQLLPWICGFIYILLLGAVLLKLFPLVTLGMLVTVPVAVKLCRHVLTYHDQPERVSNCKFIAVALHFWSGLFLGLGFILSP
ncbi:1,4-dihydroxy-2-naphthoate phytyltransferase [Leptolyngbya sp. 'hensonii']|uniref:2-carboxy-1,4-naphthoquinone phytyltransferase n=1 Tax=Leptolyngbya sp. 'hensonii' TaxID=1922337 RepID=UPI0009500BFF|nr:2-carboxy-1,4-naphthoquinone phytyltransferase [Leptolyngbya sp. 'hensonii']OLP16099.1 1,4-dihydroxy-2-naphthoate phytyltransferase [Leptolyngbya sp. 'hensonii']